MAVRKLCGLNNLETSTTYSHTARKTTGRHEYHAFGIWMGSANQSSNWEQRSFKFTSQDLQVRRQARQIGKAKADFKESDELCIARGPVPQGAGGREAKLHPPNGQRLLIERLKSSQLDLTKVARQQEKEQQSRAQTKRRHEATSLHATECVAGTHLRACFSGSYICMKGSKQEKRAGTLGNPCLSKMLHVLAHCQLSLESLLQFVQATHLSNGIK